jgi:hypothetical protein
MRQRALTQRRCLVDPSNSPEPRRPLLRGIRAAGRYTGFGERFMRRYREKGIRYVKVGGRVFFDPDHLDAFIEAHTFEGDDA